MFGHFVERMLMGGGGGSSGGGGGGRSSHPGRPGGESGERSMGPSSSSRGGGGDSGPGRSTPSAGRASDSYDRSNEQISSSIRGGGGDNDRVVSTNPGRPGGESGERSLTAGESISGSGDARSNFSYNVRDTAPSISTNNVRAPSLTSPQATFRSQRMVSLNNNRSLTPVVGGPGRTSPTGRASISSVSDDQSVADIFSGTVDIFGEELESAQDDGIVRDAMGFIAPGLGLLEMVIGDTADNKEAAQNIYSRSQDLASQYGMTLEETPLNADVSTFRDGIRRSQFPFANQEEIAKQTVAGALPEPSPPREAGGGGGSDQPFIPPQPVGPPPSQQSETAEREPRIGRLGDYSSYARRVFSRI